MKDRHIVSKEGSLNCEALSALPMATEKVVGYGWLSIFTALYSFRLACLSRTMMERLGT